MLCTSVQEGVYMYSILCTIWCLGEGVNLMCLYACMWGSLQIYLSTRVPHPHPELRHRDICQISPINTRYTYQIDFIMSQGSRKSWSKNSVIISFGQKKYIDYVKLIKVKASTFPRSNLHQSWSTSVWTLEMHGYNIRKLVGVSSWTCFFKESVRVWFSFWPGSWSS